MTEYFSHDYKSRSDMKLVRLCMKHGMEGIGIFWCLVEMLYEEEGFIQLSECDRIAFELRTEYDRIISVVKDFDLFKSDEIRFWSESVNKRIDIRKETADKNRKNVQKRWDKYQKNTTVLPPNKSGNTIKVKKSKVKKSKEDEIKIFIPPTIEQVIEFFKVGGFPKWLAEKAFNHYALNDWKNSQDKPVKNWKSTMSTNWFEEKHRVSGEKAETQNHARLITNGGKDD